jgi:hypothetical protein
MTSTKTRFALAAALAVLSTPAFADGYAISFGDGTWPAIENPAPAVAVSAQGGEAEALLAADPLFPATNSAAPAFALVAIPDHGDPQPEPAEAWVTPSYGIALSVPKAADQVATVR